MNADEIKGYLFIQSVEQFHRRRRETFFADFIDPSPLIARMTYAANGWYKISHSIPDGEFIKIAAQRDSISVEAKFNHVAPIEESDNGNYTIKNGSFAGEGTFLAVQNMPREDVDFRAKDSGEFDRFFICHSTSTPSGRIFLRWRVVLKEFST